MDISTVIGFVLVVIAIVGSILISGDLGAFYDLPSIFCVVGGVLGAIFIKWPLETVSKVGSFASKSIFYTPADPKETIDQIVSLAETARRESVFALEQVEVDDPFLKKAMTLAADNRPAEVIESILQMEIDSLQDRHKVGVKVLDGIAADGPAFGMLGTLIGLVLMLKNLSDPSAIGPSMAVALLTTFYGSIIANCLANPIKEKITFRSEQEVTKMYIITQGTLGIVAGENPRLIREKLSSFLPPALREADDLGNAGAANKE